MRIFQKIISLTESIAIVELKVLIHIRLREATACLAFGWLDWLRGLGDYQVLPAIVEGHVFKFMRVLNQTVEHMWIRWKSKQNWIAATPKHSWLAKGVYSSCGFSAVISTSWNQNEMLHRGLMQIKIMIKYSPSPPPLPVAGITARLVRKPDLLGGRGLPGGDEGTDRSQQRSPGS